MDASNGTEALLHTVDAAARRLSLGRSSTYKLIESGVLRSTKLGRRRMVSEAALRDFVTQIDGSSGTPICLAGSSRMSRSGEAAEGSVLEADFGGSE